MAVLGADVDRLDQVAGSFGASAESAERIGAGMRQMVAELEFYGRHGNEFASYLSGSAVPDIARAADALRRFQDVLVQHAAAQRGVSAGEGGVAQYVPVALAAVTATAVAATQAGPRDPRTAVELNRAVQDGMQRARAAASYADRDRAYRDAMAAQRELDRREVQRLRTPAPLTDSQLRNVNRMPPPPPDHRRIRALEARITAYDRMLGDRHQVVHFDPSGDGEVGLVVGRPIDAATRDVVVLVPGMTTQLSSFGTPGPANDYVDHAVTLDNEGPQNMATVLYLGFDAPDFVVEANNRELYERAGQRLHDFVNNDLAGRAPGADIHLLAHSAGAPVAGRALQLGANVDSLTFLAPAGAGPGVDSLDDYLLGDREVRLARMQIPGDAIGAAQAFPSVPNRGIDPPDLRPPGTVTVLDTHGYRARGLGIVDHTRAYFQEPDLRRTIIEHITAPRRQR
jgi:hypothetical protein